jgi:hypothetical protein
MVNMSKSKIRAGDNEPLMATWSIILNGTLVPATGIVSVDAAMDELSAVLSGDGEYFYVACGGNGLISGYPRILGWDFAPTNNNWVFTSDYTINMEWDESLNGTGYIVNAVADDWQFQFIEDGFYYDNDLSAVPAGKQHAGYDYVSDTSPHLATISHSVSANGISDPASSSPGWKQAEGYVLTRIGLDNQHVTCSGAINTSGTVFNHMRTRQVDEKAGSYSITETWMVFDSGTMDGTNFAGKAVEDFNINIRRSLDSDMTTVGVDGTIEGLEVRDYGNIDQDEFGATPYTVSEAKYDNASTYWSNIQTRLLPRAQLAVEGVATRNLNLVPLSRTVSHSPSRGVLGYSYEYDDRPSNCVTGALIEIISISDTNPNDIFAAVNVLGRQAGPVLQDMNTKTQRIRSLNVEVVVAPSTGCGYDYLYGVNSTHPGDEVRDNIVCPMEQEISGSASNYFIQADTENWNPKTGRYSRNVSWVFTSCTDTISPSTCSAATNEDII